MLQAASIDEFYLDFSGTERMLPDESLEGTACRIREAVLERTRISVSVGGGTRRIIAKLATNLAKPGGVHVVPAGDESEFMRRFDLGDIPRDRPGIPGYPQAAGPAIRRRRAACSARVAGALVRRAARAVAPPTRSRDRRLRGPLRRGEEIDQLGAYVLARPLSGRRARGGAVRAGELGGEDPETPRLQSPHDHSEAARQRFYDAPKQPYPSGPGGVRSRDLRGRARPPHPAARPAPNAGSPAWGCRQRSRRQGDPRTARALPGTRVR